MTMREFHALSGRFQAAREWADSKAALVCAVMVNMWRDPKKSKPAKVEDFMPGKEHSEKQTPEQMLAVVRLLNAAHGGKVVFGEFSDN